VVFHITRRGGQFGVHNHPMASWSGVYCVAPGRSDPGTEGSGRLSFINPHSMNCMYLDPGNAFLREPFPAQQPRLRPRAGSTRAVPFMAAAPCDALSRAKGERITVAFNCAFRQREG